MSRSYVTALLLLCQTLPALHCAELSQAARQAFQRYVELFDAKWKQRLRPDQFLWMDGNPAEKARALNGEFLIVNRKSADSGRDIRPPGAMVQDWLGAMFLPKASVEQVRAIMQDYKNYPAYFKPDVTESKVIRHQGDDYELFLRLYKKHVLTVVLNTTYAIKYGSVDATHIYVTSRSTRVAEVKNAGQNSEREQPAGQDNGFLWALNSYWRFAEGDGGVYAECEAILLSRDVPFGLGWIKGFLERFPKESMQSTLVGLKRAVAGQGL